MLWWRGQSTEHTDFHPYRNYKSLYFVGVPAFTINGGGLILDTETVNSLQIREVRNVDNILLNAHTFGAGSGGIASINFFGAGRRS